LEDPVICIKINSQIMGICGFSFTEDVPSDQVRNVGFLHFLLIDTDTNLIISGCLTT